MWDWIRHFSFTHTPQMPTALESAFLAQSAVISDVMKRQQDTIDKMQATLDRIVTAQYDRPITPPAQVIPADSIPDWVLNQQSDVREIETGINALINGNADEFMATLGAK